jgi:radical SAM superfamily enzyme YgiQ (UPF0313 family)
MKFSFVNPGLNDPRHAAMNNSSPPLGILYIAAVLQEAGVHVSALDQPAENRSVRDVVDWVVKENPDVLGLSTLLSSSVIAPRIARHVKRANPRILVALGNHHATFNAARILRKYPHVDLVVQGEGEHTCLQLAAAVERGRPLKEVPGIAFRHGRSIVSTPTRPLLKDVDALPFPRRDLLRAAYHNATIGINVAPKKFTTILSSRGCPFRCCFCSCTSMARNLWRTRSVDNIMEELHLLASEGYQQLMFVDDNFTLNQKRVIELCQRMRRERLDFEWICEGRVDQSSYPLFGAMVNAGCRMVYFGIESANQQVLDYFEKRITPHQSEDAVRAARRAGVDVIVGSFIVGAPNESRADVRRTLAFTGRLGLDIPQINVLSANPGTRIWEEFTRRGLLDEEKYWETGVSIPEICPTAVPLHELHAMMHRYYRRFLRSPRYLLTEVRRTLNSGYRLNVLFRNLNRIPEISHNLFKLQHKEGSLL